MGCFNQNCAISGKTILKNEEALVFVLEPQPYNSRRGVKRYQAKALPISGKYDEYGCVNIKDLKDQSYLIKALNKSLKGVKDRFGNKFDPITQETPVNHFWGNLFDYEQPIVYISKKVYDALPSIALTKEDITKAKKEMVDFRKKGADSIQMTESLKKDKKAKKELKDLLDSLTDLTDSPFFLQGQLIGRLVSREETLISYEALKDAILNNRDEEVIKLIALHETLDKFDWSLNPAGHGSQQNNKSFAVKFHDLMSEVLKK